MINTDDSFEVSNVSNDITEESIQRANNNTIYLSTLDNPYSPKTHFVEWFMFDTEHGHNSCGLLDRIARTSSQLSDIENAIEIERAIDEIIKFDELNIYTKLVL